LLKAGPYHRGLQQFVQDLNKLYLAETALWKSDYDTDGFLWIDCTDHLNSVVSFLRQDPEHFNQLVVIANLTPVPRLRYRIGLPRPGKWRELLNSDASVYGGSNMGNLGGVTAADKPWQNQPCSAEFILPPLSILVFRPARAADEVVAGAEAAPEKVPAMLPGAKQVSNVAAAQTSLSTQLKPVSAAEGTPPASASQIDRALLGDQRTRILLLSEGKGRGEGEGTVEEAPVPKADLRPLLRGLEAGH
jgi:hypothetical protein